MKTEQDFLDWLEGASIYIGYARYGQLGGHGFVIASAYSDEDQLREDIEDLDGGDCDALEAADRISERKDIWLANNRDPAKAMQKLTDAMREYYFKNLNGQATTS